MRFFIDSPARKAYLFADNEKEVVTLVHLNDMLSLFLPQNTTQLYPAGVQPGVTTHLELRDMGAKGKGHHEPRERNAKDSSVPGNS